MVSKELVRQYEQVRSEGHCNMWDRHCVLRRAVELGLEELANSTKKDYLFIIGNYNNLILEYNIKGGDNSE